MRVLSQNTVLARFHQLLFLSQCFNEAVILWGPCAFREETEQFLVPTNHPSWDVPVWGNAHAQMKNVSSMTDQLTILII